MDDDSPGGGDGYAATFYPGVVQATRARRVTVRESQELAGVDFALMRVAVGRVTGVWSRRPGGNPAGTDVRLLLADGPDVPGGVLSTWATAEGAFAFQRVRARAVRS